MSINLILYTPNAYAYREVFNVHTGRLDKVGIESASQDLVITTCGSGSAPSNGQILKYNGSVWDCGSDSTSAGGGNNVYVSEDLAAVYNNETADIIMNYGLGFSWFGAGQLRTVSADVATTSTPGIASFDSSYFTVDGFGNVDIAADGVSNDELAPQAVSTDQLLAVNKPTDEQFFTYEADTLGGEWVSFTASLITDQNAGTDITADLEEEAHCSEHDSADVDCSGETIVIAADAVSNDELAPQSVSTDQLQAINKPTDGQVFSYSTDVSPPRGEWVAAGIGDITDVGQCSTGDCSNVVFEGTAGDTIAFEGSTTNDFETQIIVSDPGQDNTWTIPDTETDTFVGTTSTQTLTNKTIDDSINSDIHANITHIPCRNESGGTLTAGTPVYVTGYSAGQDRILVDKADADDSAKMPSIALMEDDVANNATGDCILSGRISDIDTDSYSVGDELYVSTTAGTLQNTPPSGKDEQIQKVAIVLRKHATLGRIEVFGAGRANASPNKMNVIDVSADTVSVDTFISLWDSDNTHMTFFRGGDQSATINYTLPTTDGNANELLETNGSGVLSWTKVSNDELSPQAVSTDQLRATNKPTDGQVFAYESDTPGFGQWVNAGGAETNTLETTITGIELIEVFIGTGTNSGNFAKFSGDVGLDSAGLTTISADAVALTTDTTGNYAAGDAEAGAALTGDSATAFFDAGAIEANYGGTGGDSSGATGIARVDGGTWSYSELSGDITTSGSNATTIGADKVSNDELAPQAVSTDQLRATNIPTDGQVFSWEADTPGWGRWITPSGSGAPTDATYIVQALDATLSDERVITGGEGIFLIDGGAGGNMTVSLDRVMVSADALSSTTATASGLELVGDRLTLLQGCADNEILKWDEDQDDWNCEADTGGGSTKFTWVMRPHQAKLPTTNPMGIDGGNNRWRGLFDAGAEESATFEGVLYPYQGGTISADITYSMLSSTADDVHWAVHIDCQNPATLADFDTETFGTSDDIVTTVPGTLGYLGSAFDSSLNGDSCSQYDNIVVKIARNGGHADDTATGDAEFRKLLIYEV